MSDFHKEKYEYLCQLSHLLLFYFFLKIRLKPCSYLDEQEWPAEQFSPRFLKLNNEAH